MTMRVDMGKLEKRLRREIGDFRFRPTLEIYEALAVAELIEAATLRLEAGHDIECDIARDFVNNGPCNCGHDALAAALGER